VSPASAAVVAAGFALAGWGLGWLTTSGTLAAVLVGTGVLVGRGFSGAALLGLFFVSGSLLTRLSRRVSSGRYGFQTSGRNARQVIANSAWAAVAAFIPAAAGGWPLFAGALSAAQADTWATEIGAWSRTRPRLMSTGEPVPHGTSGGISVTGTLGGVSGAATTAALALCLGASANASVAALVGGILGMFTDSWFGASIQAAYYCDACRAKTEQRRHVCGRYARATRGLAWFDNDAVNLVATGVGAMTALAAWHLL
jgi:uncharacterized protein (TIGR00297 family)